MRILLIILVTLPLALCAQSKLKTNKKSPSSNSPKLVEIVNAIVEYELNSMIEEKNTNGTELNLDQRQIEGFYFVQTEESPNIIRLDFYVKYSIYDSKWREENLYKIGNCYSSFVLSKSIANSIVFGDFNEDGLKDFLYSGLHSNCSGGSGSESEYVLTFINIGSDYYLADIFFTGVGFKLINNSIRCIGKYKSFEVKRIYHFKKSINQWVLNEKESF